LRYFSAKYTVSIDYNNNLGEDAVVVFLFTNNLGKVISAPAPVVKEGSGIIKSNFYCSTFGSGTYQVSWRVYRRSDNTLANHVVWSKSSEIIELSC